MVKDSQQNTSPMNAGSQKVKERVCAFCKVKAIPRWQDSEQLREYLSPRGRILSRTITFVCARHQKKLAEAVKHARHLGLLPITTIE